MLISSFSQFKETFDSFVNKFELNLDAVVARNPHLAVAHDDFNEHIKI